LGVKLWLFYYLKIRLFVKSCGAWP
jgi:hypothetical protein